MALTLIVLLPLLTALLCCLSPFRRATWVITVIDGCAVLALVIIVCREVLSVRELAGGHGWFVVDGLGALVLLVVSFVCTLAAVFAGGYMRHLDGHADRLWWFYANYNLLFFALVAAVALAQPILVWVAVELITLFAVLLVGFERTPRALEATWKYAVLTIMGAPISLLGFFCLFWAYHSIGGAAPVTETWESLRAVAPLMPPDKVKLAFLLVLVGFGAKSGLVPMHTWLPDAHSQAPSPVCAVLSGVKTTVPLYVVLRFLSLLLASPQIHIGHWMVVFGLLSVGVAAFLLLQVSDYKRMFAYSTVEHMGIILTAAGMGTLAADSGAVWQLLNHSITKSLCFYVAGAILFALGTREIKSVRGLLRTSPFAGAALILCALAITGAPPFPIFLSEFSILSAGVHAGRYATVAVLAVLIAVAFIAIMLQVNRMVFGKPEHPTAPVALPASCRFAIVAGVLPLLLLGIYVPAPLQSLLKLAALQLGGR